MLLTIDSKLKQLHWFHLMKVSAVYSNNKYEKLKC